jgi:hypothetical protein
MTPNEETKVAQMVCRYEGKIIELTKRIEASKPVIEARFRAFDIENNIMHDIAFPTWNGMVQVWENNKPQSKIKHLSIGGPEEQCRLEQLVNNNWIVICNHEPNYDLSGCLPNPNCRPQF